MSTGSFLEKVKSAFKKVVSNEGAEVPVTRSEMSPAEGLGERSLARPAVDIFENDSELLLRADVPGATPENTTVSFNEGDGTLVFLVKTGAAPVSGNTWLMEYGEADFYRSFRLPSSVDGAKATSTVKDGLLTIRIPKRPEPAPRLIPVKAA